MSRFAPAWLGLAFSLALAAFAAPGRPPELPVETFFEEPAFTSLRFSPDGNAILCLIPHERRRNLGVIDLAQGKKTLLTRFKDRQVDGPLWVSDRRVFFLADDAGKEEFTVYSTNPDGSDMVKLTQGNFVMLRRLKDDPANILVQARITTNDWFDVARMNVRTGRTTVVARAPGNVDYYVLDHDDVVRLAVVDDPDRRRVLHRSDNRAEWQELTAHPKDQPGWEPIMFDGDNQTLFVRSDIGRATTGVFRYDTETRVLGELVFGDDTYDAPERMFYDPSRRKVVGLAYETDRIRMVWFDDEMRQLQQNLERSLPDTVHLPTQFSEDGNRIIFFSSSDRDPGVYYLYDRKRQKLDELAVVSPQVDPEQMAPVKPVQYQARDGLTIHGYLTLPVGREPRNLPLVINPHGGPYGIRDSWQFNPEVQFYANRGFAVLQINYRGSGGYGSSFEAAGFQRWGLEMQDDLTDGVRWAIAEGIADPARVIISGASFGGYAVMAGLVYTPELYAAGINYVGVVDIPTLIPKAVSAQRMYWMHTRLGDLTKAADRQRLRDTSPVNFADNIRVPLLMAYGRNDPRVKIEHAYAIEGALKKAGRPYQLIIVNDEGHGFRKEENRLAFFQQVDAFLKRHVPH
jgi:dipeptidyl aminopeptidase/acylaminoacyl peptidase